MSTTQQPLFNLTRRSCGVYDKSRRIPVKVSNRQSQWPVPVKDRSSAERKTWLVRQPILKSFHEYFTFKLAGQPLGNKKRVAAETRAASRNLLLDFGKNYLKNDRYFGCWTVTSPYSETFVLKYLRMLRFASETRADR